MRENVDKELTSGFQEAMDLGKELRVVLHVLKHFNRNDAVVVLYNIKSSLIVGYVTGNNIDIINIVTTLFGSTEDVLTLGVRVGYACNFAVRVLFCKMKRHGAPTTAQIDNLHTILDLSTLAVQIQHGNLRLLKGSGLIRPETRRILLPWTEAHIVKLGGDLVMLLVRLIGCNGNSWGSFELTDNGHFTFHIGFSGFSAENGKMIGQAETDTESNDRVRNNTSVNKRDENVGSFGQ
mmetsp:Transcript_14645/g.31760  ORF Transcript_14645/g.31760 Transcript_14645/m.31760 type:complete len:236 (-) Transcript_14645:269-976(-)